MAQATAKKAQGEKVRGEKARGEMVQLSEGQTAQAPAAVPGDAGDAAFLGVRQSVRGFVWRERLAPETRLIADAIGQRHGLPEILGRVLAARGVFTSDFRETRGYTGVFRECTTPSPAPE